LSLTSEFEPGLYVASNAALHDEVVALLRA
jgi:hypothetical protein